jgi:hypothetical protein
MLTRILTAAFSFAAIILISSCKNCNDKKPEPEKEPAKPISVAGQWKAASAKEKPDSIPTFIHFKADSLYLSIHGKDTISGRYYQKDSLVFINTGKGFSEYTLTQPAEKQLLLSNAKDSLTIPLVQQ